MPIEAAWHPTQQRTIQLQYGGAIGSEDYAGAIAAMEALMSEYREPVHIIVKRTSKTEVLQSPLTMLFQASSRLPENIGVLVFIQPSTYARMILHITRSIAPRLVRTVYFVRSEEEALRLIREHEMDSKATNESGE